MAGNIGSAGLDATFPRLRSPGDLLGIFAVGLLLLIMDAYVCT